MPPSSAQRGGRATAGALQHRGQSHGHHAQKQQWQQSHQRGERADHKRGRGPTITPFKVYWQAAHVFRKAKQQGGSVRKLSLDDRVIDKKATLALASETLKYDAVIDSLVESTGIVQENATAFAAQGDSGSPRDPQRECLLRVLLYDFLFGMKSKQPRSCQYVEDDNTGIAQIIIDNIKTLKQALYEMRTERGVQKNEDLLNEHILHKNSWLQRMPKYVRVNTLKTTVDAVVKHFVDLGFTVLDKDAPVPLAQQQPEQEKQDEDADGERAARPEQPPSAPAKWLKLDDVVENLIALGPPSSIQFHQDPLFKDSRIIIQDKSSCMPVYALHDALKSLGLDALAASGQSFDFADACAAPGNKTTYLASLYPLSKVYAFDRDQKRAADLKARTEQADASNVVVTCQDFLTVDVADAKYRNVKAFICDPSCSGSGLITREASNTDAEIINEKTLKRINVLAEFQQNVVEHAMSFPNVQLIMYSTCSVHWQENENVVKRVLANKGADFELYKALPQWTGRGEPEATSPDGTTKLDFSDVADFCIRTYPERHLTNGFFVVCFVRKGIAAGREDAAAPREEARAAAAGAAVSALPGTRGPSTKKRKREEQDGAGHIRDSDDQAAGSRHEGASVTLKTAATADEPAVPAPAKKKKKKKHKMPSE